MTAPLAPGSIVAHRFEIESDLPAPLLGTEHDASDARGGRARLSLIPVATEPEPRVATAWLACASQPARVHHAALPPILGAGHDRAAGALWVARRMVAGAPLATWARGEPRPELVRDALDALRGALASIHAARLCHGALHPERVLVTHEDRRVAITVLDLGLAEFLSEHPSIVGAPAALSSFTPPRAPGAPLEARHDAAALAAIAASILDRRLEPGARLDTLDQAWAVIERWLPRPGVRALEGARRRDEILLGADVEPGAPPPDPGAPPDPPPPAVTPSAPDVDDWIAWLQAALGAGASAERQGPTAACVRRDGVEIRVDTARGELAAGPLVVAIGQIPRSRTGDAVARALATAARAIAGARAGSGAPWRWLRRASPAGAEGALDRALVAAGLVPVVSWPATPLDHGQRSARRDEPAAGERRWHRLGLRVVLTADGVLRLAYEREGWVTSHDTGTVAHACVSVPRAALPTAERSLVELARALGDLTAALGRPDPVSHTCRFCRRAFEPLHFHLSLGACHGCAERYCGVLH